MNFRSMAVAPFVSLFLILTSIVAATFGSRQGVMVGIAQRVEEGECRTVVAHVLANGAIRLNLEPELKRTELAARLHEIFRTRAERLLFVKADPEVAFQDVADVIEIAQSEVQHVAILTPEVEKQPGVCLTIRLPVTPAHPSTPKPVPFLPGPLSSWF